jgi:hypothetical protein
LLHFEHREPIELREPNRQLASYAGLSLIGQCCEAAQVDLILDRCIPVSASMPPNASGWQRSGARSSSPPALLKFHGPRCPLPYII